jgi:hypothetical protein
MISGIDKINQNTLFLNHILTSLSLSISALLALYHVSQIIFIISSSLIFFSSNSINALLFQKFTCDLEIALFLVKLLSMSLEQLEQCIQDIFNLVFFMII